MKAKLIFIRDLIKDTLSEFGKDDCFFYAGALAFYTLFSLPPMLVIIITVAAVFLGRDAVRENILEQVESTTSANAAKQLQAIIENAQAGADSFLMTAVSVAALIFGASGLFYMLQNSLNRVWEVKAKPQNSILKFARDRLLSFSMVVLIGIFILLLFIINTGIDALKDYLEQLFSASLASFLIIANWVVPLFLLTLLFALIFRYLPDVKIRWRDVWIGSFTTVVLLLVGKFLMNFYLQQSDIGSAYGAAGSLIVLLIWIFYSSFVFFIGAEFTEVYAKKMGRAIEPVDYAVKIKRSEVETE